MNQPGPEIVTLRPENTGGVEMSFQRKMIGIPHPHVPESREKPLRAEIETLIWNNPDSEAKPGKKVQYVVMGGFVINAVEVHPILSMLTNHADTVIGISHPEAPQSKLFPEDTPFNDERSFANSAHTVLRVIEQLRESGAIDTDSPLTFVGFSTGAGVGLKAVELDQKEASNPHHSRDRLIQKGIFFAPAGIIEMGGFEQMRKAAATIVGPYNKEFVADVKKRVFELFKNPKKMAEWLADNSAPIDVIEEVLYAASLWKRLANNLRAMRDWPKNEWWQAIAKKHELQEWAELFARTPRSEFLQQLLAHFHRSWIDQPGWPHHTPETPAVKRAQANIGHSILKSEELAAIKETPMIVWFGENDAEVPPAKLLTTKDVQTIQSIKNENEQIGTKQNLMRQRALELFPNNATNTHVMLTVGEGSHHLAPRSLASAMELFILRYLYPEKMPERRVYSGSSR